jgi:hypothetical protein
MSALEMLYKDAGIFSLALKGAGGVLNKFNPGKGTTILTGAGSLFTLGDDMKNTNKIPNDLTKSTGKIFNQANNVNPGALNKAANALI